MKLLLHGSASKKNSRNLFVRNGKIVNIPSPRYKSWEEENLWLIRGKKVKHYPVTILITVKPPNKRKFDLDNRASSVMDLLVKGEVIEDDDYHHVDEITVTIGEEDAVYIYEGVTDVGK